MFINLYKVLFKPHLEYEIVSWSPYYKNDIKAIENVQLEQHAHISI